jgi:hypothetical protein
MLEKKTINFQEGFFWLITHRLSKGIVKASKKERETLRAGRESEH